MTEPKDTKPAEDFQQAVQPENSFSGTYAQLKQEQRDYKNRPFANGRKIDQIMAGL